MVVQHLMEFDDILWRDIIQYNTIQMLFASSTHTNIHLSHTHNIFYTIIDDAGGILSQLDRLPMPPVLYSKHGAGQGTVMRGGGAVADLRGGGVRTPHLSWFSIPSPGTLPPRTLFITNVKFRT